MDKIVREPVDTMYVKELDDNFIGFGAQTIKLIIMHLRTEWCVVTTLKKKEAAAAFHVQWDLTSHITKFVCKLGKQQKLCHDIGVPAPDATKVQHYVKNMYSSDMFDDKEMQAWEIKPSTDKTWEATKTHFVSLNKSKEKFNREREASTGAYKSAHSIVSAGSIGTSALGTFSTIDHQSIIEYTNSLETALEHTKDHAHSPPHRIITSNNWRPNRKNFSLKPPN